MAHKRYSAYHMSRSPWPTLGRLVVYGTIRGEVLSLQLASEFVTNAHSIAFGLRSADCRLSHKRFFSGSDDRVSHTS
jgi:hypothetical protein